MKPEIRFKKKLGGDYKPINDNSLRTAVITGGWSSDFIDKLNVEPFDVLSFGEGNWGAFSFLKEVAPSLIKKLYLKFDSCISLEGLYFLNELEELGLKIYGSVNSRESLDCSKFRNLKRISTEYFVGYSNNIFECPQLETVSFYDTYTTENLEIISRATQLRDLSINGSKIKNLTGIEKLINLNELLLSRTSIKNLDGLHSLSELEKVDLSDLRKLTSLDGLTGLKNVTRLSIESCNKVNDFSCLQTMTNLEFVYINIKEIKSLKPLMNHPCIKVIHLCNSKVLDGDMSPLSTLPKLKEASYVNKQNYNIKDKEFSREAILARS